MKPVYLEMLVLDNMVMNLLLLWTTGKVMKLDRSKWRLCLGAFIGTVYTVFFFLPPFQMLKLLLLKVILSILMVAAGFSSNNIKTFLKTLATFYGVTFIFGGAAFGSFYFLNNQVLMQNGVFYIHDFPFHMLLVSGIFAIFLIRYTWLWVRNRLFQEQLYYDMDIEFDDRLKRVKALLDTGNTLCDPISKSPVVVVEFSKIMEILPEEIRGIYLHSLENNLSAITEILSRSRWIMKFRMIPYASLGKENGMLLGFRPGRIYVYRGSVRKEVRNVIVGICANRLSMEGEYDALIHPEIMAS